MMKEGHHEDQTREYVTGLPRRAGAFQRFVEGVREIISVPHSTIARRERVYKKKAATKSKSKRTQTKGQAFRLGARFPRHGLVNGFRFTSVAGQIFVCQLLANDLTDTDIKPLRISHLAIVEAKRLFINVTEEVKWVHTDVSSVQLAVNERPEISMPLVCTRFACQLACFGLLARTFHCTLMICPKST